MWDLITFEWVPFVKELVGSFITCETWKIGGILLPWGVCNLDATSLTFCIIENGPLHKRSTSYCFFEWQKFACNALLHRQDPWLESFFQYDEHQ